MFADELYKHPQADKTSLLEGGLTSLLALAGPFTAPTSRYVSVVVALRKQSPLLVASINSF
jgi:hypothetical protein